MRIVVISGLSGSGKSSAIKTLEDIGFYCVDNLPVALLKQFLELTAQSKEVTKLALVIDARDKSHIGKLPFLLETLAREGMRIELLFLEAVDDVLVRRFTETRHRHHLSPLGSALDGIRIERKLLPPLRKMAAVVIDTSELSSHDLRRQLLRAYSVKPEESCLSILVSSFGFKYGLPTNADLVFDVRFLPNPFFKEDLKGKVGKDPEVIRFVLDQPDTVEVLTELKRLFQFLLPRFEKEGKSYLHVAVGCTGGRHRSVVVATELAKVFEDMGQQVAVNHRDMERP